MYYIEIKEKYGLCDENESVQIVNNLLMRVKKIMWNMPSTQEMPCGKSIEGC
jgi:hypothetical protein